MPLAMPNPLCLMSASAENARCQKCLEKGHWTYECKGKRKYVHRDSRTKEMSKKMKLEEEKKKLELLVKVTDNKDKKQKKKKSKRGTRSQGGGSGGGEAAGGKGNALTGGDGVARRVIRSAPPTPATPNGVSNRLGIPSLDNHRPQRGSNTPQAMPYLLSPLTPCSDPFLYLKVFEAVAKCTNNLEIRSDDSSSEDSDSSSDSESDSSSSSDSENSSDSDSSKTSDSGSTSTSSSSTSDSSSDSSSGSDTEGLSAQKSRKKKKSKKKH